MSSQRTSDYPAGQGGAAIGARLRRLSDRIDREAERVYGDLNIEFEQRWFGVLNQIVLHGPRSVGDIAEALGVTHVAVSQVRAALEKRKLITPESDPADARRALLKLTPAGRKLTDKLQPVWTAMNEAARALDDEAKGIVLALDRLERALDRQPLAERVREQMKRPPRKRPTSATG